MDFLYEKYNSRSRRKTDPVQFVYLYKDANSSEIVGFISSALAYGRVEIIINSLQKIFTLLGNDISGRIIHDTESLEKLFLGFKHRFNTGGDLAVLLLSLGEIVKKKKTLKNLFIECWNRNKGDIRNTEIDFIGFIKNIAEHIRIKKNIKTEYLHYLLASPEKNSACKRLNLFLKWMIRRDEIDPGIWADDLAHIRKHLIIPLDTHIAACARKSGLTTRKSNDWRTAVEITESLKKFEPEDPLKYDFAICHLGMDNLRTAEKTRKTP